MTDPVRHGTTWVISVHDQKVRVSAPAQVFIGRKPMRPVQVPDNAMRMDVVDASKSMSKNHAKLTVERNGNIELSDLNSTNGTYVIGAQGKLLRVPAENPFAISPEGIQGQFGDVKFEILPLDKVEEQEDTTGESQVTNLFDYQSQASDDAPHSNMSVDDILDLRAGEPTSIFAMQEPASEQKNADNVDDTFTPLFSHALRNSAQAQSESVQPEAVQGDTAQDEPVQTTLDHLSHEQHEAQVENPVENAQSAETPEQTERTQTGSEENPTGLDFGKPHVDVAATSLAAVTEDSGYMPAYEAGSVFDRLSRGDFDHPENMVEISGHTSVEAKSTRDFNTQFEIAQIPELLPFLGLNPFLYDDLYAWLVAQNSPNINSALESNEGYLAWKASNK
ncbi:FHA domain-containing protein [Alloscardovia criceti]|uniref:FHA domain-containing protein n=1 Tax=Alloscardovia criceti TaxID=356828 RepID=UPI00039CDFB6|nr:FHA domain-containing protein [Alloscardovia criceti]